MEVICAFVLVLMLHIVMFSLYLCERCSCLTPLHASLVLKTGLVVCRSTLMQQCNGVLLL